MWPLSVGWFALAAQVVHDAADDLAAGGAEPAAAVVVVEEDEQPLLLDDPLGGAAAAQEHVHDRLAGQRHADADLRPAVDVLRGAARQVEFAAFHRLAPFGWVVCASCAGRT